tara:strand:- start:75 stop:1184 length:1110 start_codon:yes stop_codon:yes gene_type:complete
MQKNRYLSLLNSIKNNSKVELIIYSEGVSYYPHFYTIIENLIESKISFNYYTSEINDHCFKDPKLVSRSFYIGKGITRLLFFALLDCKILLMSMPDLDNFHIKRSNKNVHYIYVQHSLISMHMAYNKSAFNNFDTIFCSTNYHIKEITEIEKLYNLKIKNKLKHGYGKIDFLRKHYKLNDYNNNQVLIAPSWHKGSLIDHIDVIIDNLLLNNFKIIFRPHNETINRSRKTISKIILKYNNFKNFNFDNHLNNNSIIKSEFLITDWSGIAYEYAFCTLKPILFVNTQKKINNNNYKNINLVPFEISSRKQIGKDINLDEINIINKYLLNLKLQSEYYKKEIIKIRDANIYNIDKSGKVAVKYINKILYNE